MSRRGCGCFKGSSPVVPFLSKMQSPHLALRPSQSAKKPRSPEPKTLVEAAYRSACAATSSRAACRRARSCASSIKNDYGVGRDVARGPRCSPRMRWWCRRASAASASPRSARGPRRYHRDAGDARVQRGCASRSHSATTPGRPELTAAFHRPTRAEEKARRGQIIASSGKSANASSTRC